MIETKLFELRDAATFIPIIASRMVMLSRPDPERLGDAVAERREAWLLRRAGYAPDSEPLVLLTGADGGRRAEYDPYSHGGRTFPVAHEFIAHNWNALVSGEVIDVRVLLGETSASCESEEYGA